MDIFTTLLTRVVPVPIKPTSLKVKALVKEAAPNEVSQDPDHLENHNNFFITDEGEHHYSQEKTSEEGVNTIMDAENNKDETSESDEEIADDKKNKDDHLDLYA